MLNEASLPSTFSRQANAQTSLALVFWLNEKVGLPGFEPRLREPKPLVLPLHHSPILNQTLLAFVCCKDSANRIQRAYSLLRCSLFSQCEFDFRAAKVQQKVKSEKRKIICFASLFYFAISKKYFFLPCCTSRYLPSSRSASVTIWSKLASFSLFRLTPPPCVSLRISPLLGKH